MTTFGRLLKLIAPFKGWMALAIMLSFATIGSSVGLMAMSAYLISKSALVTSLADVSLAITGVRFFAISRAALRYTERTVSHTVTFRILTRLRVWFYEAIEPLAPARLGDRHSGDLLARIVGDIETLQTFYARVIVPPIVAALVTGLAALILGWFDWRLGVALVAFLALTGVGLPLLTRRLGSASAAATVAGQSALQASVADTVLGLPDLLLGDPGSRYWAKASLQTTELNRLEEREAVVRGLSHGLLALFTGLAAVTVLLIAVPLVTAGQIEGVYLALIPLTAIASFEAVQPLAVASEQLEQSRAAADRLFDLIDAEPAVVDPPRPAPPPAGYDVRFENVTFSYGPADPDVLAGFTLVVEEGERVAVVGPSGIGKTTLVSLLLRYWEPDAGDILIGGRSIRDLPAEDVRSLVGVVAQDTYLFNSTIRDNLLLARSDADDNLLTAALVTAQLGDFLAQLPHGLDTAVGENGLQLSGGERQRLAIARVLLKDAPILVLDEATAHLDPVTEEAVWAALAQAMDGRTVLVITHQAGGLRYVDRVEQVGQPALRAGVTT